MPSSRDGKPETGKLHVGIIMDGNGRWAARRGLPRTAGHEAGIEALRRMVQAASGLGIGTLTVHAFSADNWKRPQAEVLALMDLFRRYLDSETEQLVRDGVKLSIVGRRDRLSAELIGEIERSEAATEWGDDVHLRVCVDYSAREAILAAAKTVQGELTRESLEAVLGNGTPPVDLLIRTSGEQRLSDFLLWECAYAELYFTPKLWPDFAEADLAEAIADFRRRERRFGSLTAANAA